MIAMKAKALTVLPFLFSAFFILLKFTFFTTMSFEDTSVLPRWNSYSAESDRPPLTPGRVTILSKRSKLRLTSSKPETRMSYKRDPTQRRSSEEEYSRSNSEPSRYDSGRHRPYEDRAPYFRDNYHQRNDRDHHRFREQYTDSRRRSRDNRPPPNSNRPTTRRERSRERYRRENSPLPRRRRSPSPTPRNARPRSASHGGKQSRGRHKQNRFSKPQTIPNGWTVTLIVLFLWRNKTQLSQHFPKNVSFLKSINRHLSQLLKRELTNIQNKVL